MNNPFPIKELSPELVAKLQEGLRLHSAGDLDGAYKVYFSIISKDITQPDALHMMGVIAQQRGNPELALKMIDASLGARPDMPMAWFNRALVLRTLGRVDEARASADEAIRLNPDEAGAHDMLGLIYEGQGQFELSRHHHLRALEIDPYNAAFHLNYTALLMREGNYQDAYRHARLAEKLAPDYRPSGIASVLRASGYPYRSISYFAKARATAGASDSDATQEAMTRLMVGDFKEGWKAWEARGDLDAQVRAVPLWDGKAVEHLLVHEDQGIGDGLMMARFLPLLREKAQKISYYLPPPLQQLMTTNFPWVNPITQEGVIDGINKRVRLSSLPALMDIELSDLPGKVPYLSAHEGWREPWRKRLKAVSGPRIGFVWSGNPKYSLNYLRRLPVTAAQDIVRQFAQHMVLMQKSPLAEEITEAFPNVFNADPWLDDFAATAGLIAELDLVVTIDTSTAHLAGAMGKPVFVLLSFDPDWRWMLAREDSPWYPSARLFRQTTPRDWSAVIRELTGAINLWLAGDLSQLKPKTWMGPPALQNPNAIPLIEP